MSLKCETDGGAVGKVRESLGLILCGPFTRLYKISWQSIRYLLRYLAKKEAFHGVDSD